MKTDARFRVARVVLAFLGLAVLNLNLLAQSYTLTGTNQPGAAMDFSIPLGPGATNLSLSVAGTASSYSQLLLRAGVAPSATNYDYIALQTGQGNAINLEAPEFKLTNYVLRVFTPTNSLAHTFTVSVLTNATDFRSLTRPATKTLITTNQGTLIAASWHYYRIDVPTNVTGWRVLVSSANNGPDVYIQRNALPGTGTYLKRSVSLTNDDIAFTADEAIPGAYYIGVYQVSSSSSYTLRTEFITITPLTWDPGLTHLGTQVYTNATTNGGDYFFKITVQNTTLGAWRTALNVSTGEAAIYLLKGSPPAVANNAYKSERTGSDGFVVPASAFSAGEDWYYLVRANPGAQWNLVSGEPFVTDLGVVAADASSGSGNLTMGAEGMRFFQTTLPANANAWRLWLNGATNQVLVKKTGVPLTGVADLSQARQMLVVPSYLVGGQLYFVGVSGAPGASLNLDSRLQSFTDIPFVSATTLNITNYGYATFRVQVPADQLAWQMSVVVSNGNPNLAVRRNFIPNENYNDAYSEVASNVTDSITLVPPTLSDGTFYITVYGTNSYSCTLNSGNPEFTEISFTSAMLNTDTNRVGWRFFKLSNIAEQVGALGWDLLVTNAAPGTRLALRRNAAPGIWTYRNPNNNTAGTYDYVSTTNFLQRPGHQADIWYVGVYTTNNALGPFTLIARELTTDPLTFDNGSAVRTAVPPGKWQFFRVNVPANTLGWDVRVTSVTSGQPRLVVRRELLPVSLLNSGFSLPNNWTNWPTGYQWAAADDWTSRDLSADGTLDETGRILTMGYGRPLEAGTYYVGVISPATSTEEMSYTLLSRGIGPGQTIPVTDLDYAGGSGSHLALEARDIAVYRINIATNTPSWKVRLEVTGGDAVMAVGWEKIPNISALFNSSVHGINTAGRRMLSSGNEHFVLLPPPAFTNVFAGDYYLVVASDGQVGTNSGWIGTGTASYTLQSLGPLPEVNLGLLDTNDLVFDGQLEGGEVAAFHFTNHPFPLTLGFELSLENRVGNPVMVSRGTKALADPGAASSGNGIAGDSYGSDGGEGSALQASGGLITVADPYDIETVMLKARAVSGDYPDASYTLRVRKLVPTPVAFDGGTITITGQTNAYTFYKIVVPTNALGWEVRLTNVVEGIPELIIARDVLPLDVATPGWNPGLAAYWPVYANWIAAKDWTQRSFSPAGENQDGRILAMGMGRPLEPGTYYVGVHNSSFPSPLSFTLTSRGIGAPYSIPVVDLTFAGGSATNLNVPPREAAYYRVVVPPEAASWQVKMTTLTGEAMLVMLTNSVPSVLSGRAGNAGELMQKPFNEHFVMLPVEPEDYLAMGTNYLAVVSEGSTVTNTTRVGVGTSSWAIQSRGELAVIDLGLVGSTDLANTNTLEGGEVRAYQFTVPEGIPSLEVQLQNNGTNGRPIMVLRTGGNFPSPGAASPTSGSGTVGIEEYGNEGGYPLLGGWGNANSNRITIPNPTNGIYTLMVKARGVAGNFSNANYTVTVRALDYRIVDFDGGATLITNQPPNTWRYFQVDVPDTALGWDARVTDVKTGQPKVVVKRDAAPNSLLTTPWGNPGTLTSWPTTNQWAVSTDWTRRNNSADNLVVEDYRIFATGMGQPLEAGTYYVGVFNNAGSNANYTFSSRGIGDGLAAPFYDLPYAGGSITISNLPARDAAYFRVQIPSNSPGWKVRLNTIVGEAMVLVLSNHVPNIDSGRITHPLAGKYMQKAGDEHYLTLPLGGGSNIISGTYYIAAVSEGINPASATRIGSGSSSFTLTSVGDVPVADLGVIGGTDFTTNTTLNGGESQIYRFSVPPNIGAIEMRLENRTGNPVMVVSTNSSLPDPGGVSSPKDLYGNEGGSSPGIIHSNMLTIANPTNGVYVLAVKARALGTVYPDATYTLRIRQVPVPDLNFSSQFNTNGLSHSASGLLLDNQRAFYKVVVPAQVNGQPVIGWQLDLAQSSGQAGLRVRKDLLPSDAVTGMPFTPNSAIIAPAFLTNGVWYVEVRGTNSTTFTLTSSPLLLQRPAWAMPNIGQAVTTPGLSAPEFGDSGTDTNGAALPNDRGIDLEFGRYHYYAIVVPTNNSGLLRVQLEAISGNPDFYLRSILVPTASHASNGLAGTAFERSLVGSTTEYGNFVPRDGTLETNLTPGLWYCAVRAVNNANARYRLRLSTGFIQDLAMDGGALTNQSVAGSDWKYYRVRVPATPQANWQVTFSQEQGDVVLYLRDTVPPGNGASTNAAEYKDWISDDKNDGPYANYDTAGSYTFSFPPVRPDSYYYLGFRAKADSTFSVSSAVSGITNDLPPLIPFYGGSVTNTIPGNSQVMYRIFAPADALRWRHTSIHAATVQVFIENGTYPNKTTGADFRSTVPNSTKDVYLVTYPWVPNQTFYLLATNSTATPQLFNFNMNGSSTTADDDGDGMLDVWEIQYFGALSAPPNGDPDGDGVSNLNEFLEGTIPNNKASFRPRLTLFATNGVVNVNPAASNYAMGDTVTLTATPNTGYEFVSWTGGAIGTSNPLQLTMDTNKVITPRFRVPGDDFDQRIPLAGATVTHSGLQNTGATKETGEPNHAGTAGGKSLWWTWTAPLSGPVSLNTAGSIFRNALAVYTGTALTNLTAVATNLAGAGTNTSQVNFTATAGTTYQIAVDGFSGASGSVVLNLSMPSGNITLSQPVRAGDGFFQFTINSAAGLVLTISASTNLVDWIPVAVVTNTTGTLQFVDPNSPSFVRRFYRVALGASASNTPLVLSSVTRLADGQFRFTLVGSAGQVVRIQNTTDPAQPGWTTLATVTNTGGTMIFTDSTAPGQARRFYRAISP